MKFFCTLFYIILTYWPGSEKKEESPCDVIKISSYTEYYKFLKDTNTITIKELYINGDLISKSGKFKFTSDSFFIKLEKLVNLKILTINSCQLTNIPDQVNKLKQIELLDLSSNLISTCSDLLISCRKLKEINLSFNEISNVNNLFSGDISNSQLFFFNISSNLIDSIPESICRLKYLEYLVLDFNRICKIPCCLNKFECLSLLISNNQIKEIPECFCRQYKYWFEIHFNMNPEIKLPTCIKDTSISNKLRIHN